MPFLICILTFDVICSFYFLFYFFDIFIHYAITVVPFPPLHTTPSCPPYPSHIPPLQFMSMGHTYKFFGFYISYTILTLPLSIFHLSFMLFVLCTFPTLSPSQSPIDNPPCDLHFCGSVSVLVVCLVFYKGVPIRLSADFLKETLQARRDWQKVFQVMKGQGLHPRLLYPVKLSFRMEGQIKCFSDVKLKEFIITKPLLYGVLKGLF